MGALAQGAHGVPDCPQNGAAFHSVPYYAQALGWSLEGTCA